MVEQDHKEENKPLRQELAQTLAWIGDWHCNFRKSHQLTDSRLATLGEQISSELIEIADHSDYSMRVATGLHSDFGIVSVLQLERLTGDATQPLMARFFYQDGDYGKLVAVSFGWRFSDSAVVYEMVSFASGQIDRVAKITQAGILFNAPPDLLSDRESCQSLEVDFIYNGDAGWFAKLGFEREAIGVVNYKDGIITATHGFVSRDEQGRNFYIKDGTKHFFPTQLDPIPHLQNIFRNNNPHPLL